MKIANFAIAAICFLFAYFQSNDPDPLLWIVVYGMVGMLALFAGLGKHWMPATALAAGVCIYLLGMCHDGLVQFLTNEDGQTVLNPMSKEYDYVEVFREFGGLVILLIFLSVIACSGCCFSKGSSLKQLPDK